MLNFSAASTYFFCANSALPFLEGRPGDRLVGTVAGRLFHVLINVFRRQVGPLEALLLQGGIRRIRRNDRRRRIGRQDRRRSHHRLRRDRLSTSEFHPASPVRSARWPPWERWSDSFDRRIRTHRGNDGISRRRLPAAHRVTIAANCRRWRRAGGCRRNLRRLLLRIAVESCACGCARRPNSSACLRRAIAATASLRRSDCSAVLAAPHAAARAEHGSRQGSNQSIPATTTPISSQAEEFCWDHSGHPCPCLITVQLCFA